MPVTGDKVAFGNVWCVSDSVEEDIDATTIEVSSVTVQLISVTATAVDVGAGTRFRVASADGTTILEQKVGSIVPAQKIFDEPRPLLRGLLIDSPIIDEPATTPMAYSVIYRIV